jgi:DNA-binding response OmpR family regulator
MSLIRLPDQSFGTLVQGLDDADEQLLLLFATSPTKVFSRDAIIDRLHGPGFAITDRTIDSHVKRMRKKFRVVDPEFDAIETLYGVGYRYRES